MSGCRVFMGVVLSGSAGADGVDVECFEDPGLEAGGDGEGSFEVAVAAFDDFLAFVTGQDFGGVDGGGVEVGEQAVPAVGGGFGVEGGLVEPPAQGRFAGRVDADLAAQVVADSSFG